MEITGTVVYQELEGGFWGIEGDNGHKYKPVNDLPKSVQIKGQRIRAEVEPAMVMGIAMWGRTVNVSSIETL